MDAIVELRALRKEYFETVALQDVDLSIPRGEILGLIGPNGAGKTTLLRLVATTLEPTAGEVVVDGQEVWTDPVAVRAKVGYMPDFFQVYRQLTVRDFLTFFAIAHGLSGPRRGERVDEVIAEIGLQEKADERCRGLSRGMVQRLGLGRAILHEPPLLLLDEPASGLDPLARKVLFDVLRQCHRRGTTIVISSHILGELSDLCTSVCMMDRGHIAESGGTRDVIGRLLPKRSLVLRVLPASQETAVERLSADDGVENVQTDNGAIAFTFDGTDEALSALLASLVVAGVQVVTLAESASSLHEAYFALTQKGGE